MNFYEFRSTAMLLSVAILFAGCAINPATGKRHLNMYSEEQEVAIGRENDVQMSASLGLYDDVELANYVEALGQKLAVTSERPDLEWHFRLVDDPVINAFALPGGYVYITRGILAYMNNEAELAGVMGHEIGHVTAKHSVNQMTKQKLGQAGLTGLSVAAGATMGAQYGGLVADLGGQSLGLAFLKFSREDETQADELGLRYLVESGYDPRPMPEIYSMLNAVSEAAGATRVPAMFSTHPDPGDRQERMASEIGRLDIDLTDRPTNRDEFLARIEGISFGPDPREGFFRGSAFLHPEMEFRIDFPPGWRTINQRTVVAAVSGTQDAVVQLSLAAQSTPRAALDAFFAPDSVSRGPSWRDEISGFPAESSTMRAVTDGGTLRGYVAMIEYGGSVFQIQAMTLERGWEGYKPSLARAVESFRLLTDPRALAAEPKRIRIVRPERPMDLPEFARTFDATVDIQTLAIMNHLDMDDTVEAGRPYKVVVGGTE